MTGYGMGEYSNDKFHVKVEIKSVNNRYCDISIRLPKSLMALEDKIKKEIRNKVSRGKVDVFINVENLNASSSIIDVDLSLANQYFLALSKLKNELEIADDISLKDIYIVCKV
ncbi:YicC/YloC family endoribonuclease [Peptoniphilus stercorisuis]|nr:YicC/YloC family endoribonuclease [Peptoniphilus stercorisuis]